MIVAYRGNTPEIDPSAVVMPTAVLIGNVVIGERSSIWFQVVARADVNSIRIGARTNIQDGTVIHVSSPDHSTRIGDDVTVGHNATLHGCKVGDGSLVGIGAILLDGVEVGDGCLIAAGSLLTPGTVVPAGSLVVGSPARVKRPLSTAEQAGIMRSAENYLGYPQGYTDLDQRV